MPTKTKHRKQVLQWSQLHFQFKSQVSQPQGKLKDGYPTKIVF